MAWPVLPFSYIGDKRILPKVQVEDITSYSKHFLLHSGIIIWLYLTVVHMSFKIVW